MKTGKGTRLTIVTAIAAAAIGATGYLAWPEPMPEIDPRLRAEIVPVVQRHLENVYVQDGLLSRAYASLKPRVFCDVELIETRASTGGGAVTSELRAGVHADCSEYAARGGSLLGGTASSGPMLVTLRSPNGVRQVVKVEVPGLGSDYPRSVQQMFTKAGQAALDRHSGGDGMDRLADRARGAYGLPSDAPLASP